MHVVLGRLPFEGGAETTYTDIYVCDKHMPVLLAAEGTVDMSKVLNWGENEREVRKLLKWDDHDEWRMLEFTVSHLR